MRRWVDLELCVRWFEVGLLLVVEEEEEEERQKRWVGLMVAPVMDE